MVFHFIYEHPGGSLGYVRVPGPGLVLFWLVVNQWNVNRKGFL